MNDLINRLRLHDDDRLYAGADELMAEAADALDALRAQLAAIAATEPVAYITDTEQGPMLWTPEMYEEACTYCDDDELPVPLYTAAPAPVAQRCTYCDGTGDVHGIDGEWRGSCPCAAAPAPQAQDKSDNYLSGYCTGRTDLLKEQSAQQVAQPLTDEQIMAIGREMGLKCKLGGNPNIDFDYARAIEAAHGIREVK